MIDRTIWKSRAIGVGLAAAVIAIAVSCTRSGTISTTVGSGPSPTCATSTNASDACIGRVDAAASDSAGNVYFTESIDNGSEFLLRRLTPAGVLSTIAGGGTSYADGAVGSEARLQNSTDHYPLVRVANGSFVVVSETASAGRAIRRIATNGTVTTVPNTAGRDPVGLAIDGSGNLYSLSNCSLMKFGAFGVATVVAGQFSTCGSTGDGGPATSALIRSGQGFTIDASGIIFLPQYSTVYADSARIRKIDANGIITAYAGTGVRDDTGDGGPATAAQLTDISALTPDGNGGVLIGCFFSRVVRHVDAAGTITRFAGNPAATSTTDGVLATETGTLPTALTRSSGTTFVFENRSAFGATRGRLQRIDASGIVTTVLDKPDVFGDGGAATQARLDAPSGVAFDASGNEYIADTSNNRIRKVTTAGVISTIAGTPLAGFAGDGGPATAARLNHPTGLTFDPAGNLYIADRHNLRVRMVDPAGVISTVAGDGTAVGGNADGGDGGAAAAAQLAYPAAVAFKGGDLYIGDEIGLRVRRVHGTTISTFVGGGGTGNNFQRGGPTGLAVDRNGQLLIAASMLYRADPAGGAMATVSGTFGAHAVAVDDAGRIELATDFAILEISTSGEVTRPVGPAGSGSAASGFAGDGGPGAAALLRFPTGVAVDPQGNLAIADTGNNRIRTMVWAR